MTKNDLAQKLSDNTGCSLSEAYRRIDQYHQAVSDLLVSGENLMLKGFGTYKLTYRKARTGRNPKTGERMSISARFTITFRAGKKLLKLINHN